MKVDPHLISVENGLAVGSLGPICVAIWRGAVTPPAFERQKSALAEVVTNAKGHASFICVVEPGTEPPSQPLRKASAEMLRSHGADLSRVAVVIEGEGFKAAVTRTVMSGIALLWADREARNAYFSDVDAAAKWIAPDEHLELANEIVKGVEEIRSGLSPREN